LGDLTNLLGDIPEETATLTLLVLSLLFLVAFAHFSSPFDKQ
jgi:hypothetical protein